ncbi:MAG: TIGR03915 family putative DNA repair protein [Caldimicrobium sp.]
MQIVLYDGTPFSFLTLLYEYVLEKREEPIPKIYNLLLRKERAGLFTKEISPDYNKALKLKEILRAHLGEPFLKRLYHFYLCDSAFLEETLIKGLRRALENPEIVSHITDEDFGKLARAEKELFRERHQWLGMLRFIEVTKGILLAVYEPKFNTTPLLTSHFMKRFPQERFVIFDSLRKILFSYRVFNEKEIFFGRVENFEFEIAENDAFIELFKTYFNKIAIPERKSLKRQRQKVPLRIRKFLVEFS